MKKKSGLLLLPAILFSLAAICQGNPGGNTIIAGAKVAVVETESGKVRGYIHKNIFTYKGIPYAQAERFMPPAKPATWEGVRNSFTYGPVCPMDPTTKVNDEIEFPFNHNWGYTNENCLSLNVWTPGINDGKKRPVMLWFHGGGFTAGSSVELPSYDGESLSRKGDVVVVSVNHRLNVLGFLDLSEFGEKYKSSGNVGIMDLVAALQWVKQNIGRFGGDPGNVTIFGQSGGGAKVTTLMNVPSAQGLFQKAIVQSGSYRMSLLEAADTKRVGAALLEELGLLPSQADSLQKVSYELLNAAGKKALQKVQEKMKTEGKPVGIFGLSWGPVRDGYFLPYQLTEPVAIAMSKDIPLLIGSTKNEFMASMLNPAIRSFSMDEAKSYLQKMYAERTDDYLAAVKKAYPNTNKPSDFIDIDLSVFRPGTVKQANLKSASTATPVYMYLFEWQSPVLDGAYKSLHCMELPFVFNNIGRCEEMTGGGNDAYLLASKMSQAWINFARSGNPNHKDLPTWQPYTEGNGTTMIFDNLCTIKHHHDKELLELTVMK